MTVMYNWVGAPCRPSTRTRELIVFFFCSAAIWGLSIVYQAYHLYSCPSVCPAGCGWGRGL